MRTPLLILQVQLLFVIYLFSPVPHFWSQTTVVSCPLAISQTGLLPARHRLSFHVLYGSCLLAMAGRYFGAQYRACILASPGFRLPLPVLPADSATDPARLASESVAGRLLAMLWSGGTFPTQSVEITHWVTITHFIPTYKDSQGLGFTLARGLTG